MGLETAQYVEDLNPLWPLSTDKKQEGDDQLRLLKSVLQNMTADQAQVTAKDNRVWLSASALAMDIDFTGAITKSGEGIATLGANTFTSIQTIETSIGNSTLELKAPNNTISSVALIEDGVSQGLLYNSYSEDSVNLRKYNAEGTGPVAQLNFTETGLINATFGQLQQAGVNVATVGANIFTGDQVISNVIPKFQLYDSDDVLDNKYWDFVAFNGTLLFQATNDDQTVNTTYMEVQRTGTTIDSVTIAGTTVNITGTNNQVNGVEIATVDQISAMSYGGYSNIDATVTAVPQGWTITKAGVGLYRVTHNLGLLISDIFPTANAHSAQIYCTIDSFTANSFLVNTRNVTTAAFTDSAFSFNCTTL